MKKFLTILIAISFALLTGCSNGNLGGDGDITNLEKELIKIEQDLAKEKNGKYKYIEKYEKDGYEFTVDEIVVWNGSMIPEDIGYKITIIDSDGKVKKILKMDKDEEIETDWIAPVISTTTATSTL